MYKTTLALHSPSAHPLIEALESLYDARVIGSVDDSLVLDDTIAAVVIDCTDRTADDAADIQSLVSAALFVYKPVVFIEVQDGELLAHCGVVGVSTPIAILSANTDGTTNLDVMHAEVCIKPGPTVSASVEQDASGTQNALFPQVSADAVRSAARDDCLVEVLAPSVDERARWIESKIADYDATAARPALASGPGQLPPGQVQTTYFTDNQMVHLLDSSGTRVQTATNAVTFDVALVASFSNPPYKYLRVVSRGAGFSPTSGAHLAADSKYNRGIFQGSILLNMATDSTDLTVLHTSPRNVNSQSQYTSSSSFSTGVDVSQNPGYSASYTISESETHSVSDFDIQNMSYGKIGQWDWRLGLLKKSVWDMFKRPVFRKAQVKRIANLARANLQADAVTVWYADNQFTGTIPLQLFWDVTWYHCWVTGSWTKYWMHYDTQVYRWGYFLSKPDNPLLVNFNAVNPMGGA